MILVTHFACCHQYKGYWRSCPLGWSYFTVMPGLNLRAGGAHAPEFTNGVILLYNRICAKANAELDILLEESEIDRILRGEDQDAAPEVIALAEREAQEFINDLLSGLRERMLELKSGKVIFLGGGATLLRRQIEASGKIGQAIFVEDINANAKGYEYLYRLQHSGR